jgi:neopullulanase
MTRLLAAFLSVPLCATLCLSQSPVVVRVEPPNWWAGHSINPVRLLIRGQHLTGAKFLCPSVFLCANLRVNEAGTYAFMDVTVHADANIGTYVLALNTPAGQAKFDFTVSAPLPKAGRFAGFDTNDVVYLIMPDRFANGDPSNDSPFANRSGMMR